MEDESISQTAATLEIVRHESGQCSTTMAQVGFGLSTDTLMQNPRRIKRKSRKIVLNLSKEVDEAVLCITLEAAESHDI